MHHFNISNEIVSKAGFTLEKLENILIFVRNLVKSKILVAFFFVKLISTRQTSVWIVLKLGSH